MDALSSIPQEVQNLVWMLLYLTALGLFASVIYSIVEWFSKDRVLKVFERRRVLLVMDEGSFYGKLYIPSRSGGGFELFFDEVENPLTLLAFLVENYKETGDEKFLREAREIAEKLEREGALLPGFELEGLEYHPWSPPSLASKKIYPGDLNKVSAMIQFREAMDEKELERRRKELRRLYHPPLHSRIARRVYNALAYVKDKIASSLSLSSRIPTSMIPGAREIIAEAEKKALAPLGATYDPLLENGIGRLVTLRVKDVDGSERRYQGILREYSAKYIAVYDVDYRIGMVCCFRGSEKLPGYPKPKLAGLDRGVRGGELRARLDRGAVVIENLDERPVRIEKVSSGDAVVEVGKILEPGASLRVGIPEGFGEEYCVEYEVCREADVVWPRSKAVVVGLGDYPPRILELLVS